MENFTKEIIEKVKDNRFGAIVAVVAVSAWFFKEIAVKAIDVLKEVPSA